MNTIIDHIDAITYQQIFNAHLDSKHLLNLSQFWMRKEINHQKIFSKNKLPEAPT